MFVLGIRCTPTVIYYCVIDDNEKSIKTRDSLKIPQFLDIPCKLKYLRNTMLDIIREFNVTVAGIKLEEGNSKQHNVDRIYNEAVIQEALSSSPVKRYFTGRIKSMASKLGVTDGQLKEYIKGTASFPVVDHWEWLDKAELRESALVALGAIK